MEKQINVRFTVDLPFEIDVTEEEWAAIEEATNRTNDISYRSPAWGIIMDKIDLNDALDGLTEVEVDTYQYE